MPKITEKKEALAKQKKIQFRMDILEDKTKSLETKIDISEDLKGLKNKIEKITLLEVKVENLENRTPSFRETAILEEYKTLRNEILDQIKAAHQINQYSLAFGGVVGAGALFGQANYLLKGSLLLLVGIIFWKIIKTHIDRRKKIFFIGRYIQYQIEPEIEGLLWENAWDRDNNDLTNVKTDSSILLTIQNIAFIGASVFFGVYFDIIFSIPQTLTQWIQAILTLFPTLLCMVIYRIEKRLMNKADGTEAYFEELGYKRSHFEAEKEKNVNRLKV